MNTQYNENIRRVGIYGGTFAPPHVGHVEAAKAFMKQMRLDYLFVIPAAIPPHKKLDFDIDPMHRLAMCDLAFSGIDGVIVSDLELRYFVEQYVHVTQGNDSRKGNKN